jgi:hypothetical protein
MAIDGQLLEDIRILAIRKRCSSNDLIEEAITDLLRKYEETKTKERNESTQGDVRRTLLHCDPIKSCFEVTNVSHTARLWKHAAERGFLRLIRPYSSIG